MGTESSGASDESVRQRRDRCATGRRRSKPSRALRPPGWRATREATRRLESPGARGGGGAPVAKGASVPSHSEACSLARYRGPRSPASRRCCLLPTARTWHRRETSPLGPAAHSVPPRRRPLRAARARRPHRPRGRLPAVRCHPRGSPARSMPQRAAQSGYVEAIDRAVVTPTRRAAVRNTESASAYDDTTDRRSQAARSAATPAWTHGPRSTSWPKPNTGRATRTRAKLTRTAPTSRDTRA